MATQQKSSSEDAVLAHLRKFASEPKAIEPVLSYLRLGASIQAVERHDPGYLFVSGLCSKEYGMENPPEHAVVSRLLLYHGFRSVDEIVSETHLPYEATNVAVNSLWSRHQLLRISHDGVTRYIPYKQRPFETIESLVTGESIPDMHLLKITSPPPIEAQKTQSYPPSTVPPVTSPATQPNEHRSLYRRAVNWFRSIFT